MKKRLIALVFAICMMVASMSVANAQTISGETKLVTTPADMCLAFGDNVAKLTDQNRYSALEFTSASVNTKKGTFSFVGSGKRTYATTETMKVYISGKINSSGNIVSLTMSAAPARSSARSTGAYREDWSHAMVLTLESLFQNVDTQKALDTLTAIKLPVALTSTEGVTGSYAGSAHTELGGLPAAISGSLDKKGNAKLVIDITQSAPAPAEPVTPANGSTVNVALGDTFVVNLAFSSGTGYTWEYGTSGTGASRLVSTAINGANLPGGTQTETWKFSATKIGKQKFTFVLSRPWEGTKKGDKMFSFTVNITR